MNTLPDQIYPGLVVGGAFVVSLLCCSFAFARRGDLLVQDQRAGFCLLCGFVFAYAAPGWADSNALPSAPRYAIRADHDPNGIGKFYLGREIADVMGHQAADWLERPERQQEERTDLLVPLLKLKPGDTVADIGAGTGYYSRLLAKAVAVASTDAQAGLVYAEDIQPEMLVILTNKMAKAGLRNVRPVLGTITDPRLPRASLDLILMVDVYHEFDHPFEMVAAMCRALKPGGRIVFVEFRGEDPNVPIKLVHKMTVNQVRKEMAVQPLEWVETIEKLPQQHVIVFRKKGV
jgi:ubiquinone/menaquinone biosynthesis C-methylase UbiE